MKNASARISFIIRFALYLLLSFILHIRYSLIFYICGINKSFYILMSILYLFDFKVSCILIFYFTLFLINFNSMLIVFRKFKPVFIFWFRSKLSFTLSISNISFLISYAFNYKKSFSILSFFVLSIFLLNYLFIF